MQRSPALTDALFNKARHLGHLAAIQMMRTIAGYRDHSLSLRDLEEQLKPGKVNLLDFPALYRNSAAMPGRLKGIRTDILETARLVVQDGMLDLDRTAVDWIRRELPLVPVAVFVACAGLDAMMDVEQIARRRMSLRPGEYYPILLPERLIVNTNAVFGMVRDAFETEGIYTVVTIQHNGCPDMVRADALQQIRERSRALGMDTIHYLAQTSDGTALAAVPYNV